jgi:hypothetical protein
LGSKSLRFVAVVSHISRKTSEMWGTRQLWQGQVVKSSRQSGEICGSPAQQLHLHR